MKRKWFLMLGLVLVVGLVLAPSLSSAKKRKGSTAQNKGEICDNGKDDDYDKAIDCDDSECEGDKSCMPPPPPKGLLCHNIGGPEMLGANCDNSNADEFPCVQIDNPLVYAGIVIGAGENSYDAHLRHGDGFALAVFDPPLHLASEGLNHQASNVECVAIRAITEQPPEPGN